VEADVPGLFDLKADVNLKFQFSAAGNSDRTASGFVGGPAAIRARNMIAQNVRPGAGRHGKQNYQVQLYACDVLSSRRGVRD